MLSPSGRSCGQLEQPTHATRPDDAYRMCACTRATANADRARQRRAFSTRKLHKRLHTHRIRPRLPSRPQHESPTSGDFAEPSDGLEPSTPSLPCAPKPLPWVATRCGSACLSGFERVPFATGCHRLRPLGSINAPSSAPGSLMDKGIRASPKVRVEC